VQVHEAVRPTPAPHDATTNHTGFLVSLLVVMLILHGTCDNTAYSWMPRVLDSYPAQPFRSGFVMAAFGLVYLLGGRC